MQRPHKEESEEARYGSNKKRGKTVHFDGTTEEMNIINACDKTTKRKKRIHAKKPKSDKDTTIPEEKELTYGIDCLNIGDPAVESENDSK